MERASNCLWKGRRRSRVNRLSFHIMFPTQPELIRYCGPCQRIHSLQPRHPQRQIQIHSRWRLGPHSLADDGMAFSCSSPLRGRCRAPTNLITFIIQADLDSDPVIRGRPVVLQSKDCHALWVSSKALEVSLPFPEDVDGGVIIRDSSGRPTGTLN